MWNTPIPDPNKFKIYFELQEIKNILSKLDSIDALTDNPHVKDKTEYIRNIINKQI